MKFCKQCEFMLHIKITDENELSYECKNCGHLEDHPKTDTDNCIYSIDYKTDKISYSWMINKYLCDDPTIPRVGNIPCPNEECSSNSSSSPTPTEVIYVKYDKANLKYFYMCCHCKTTWKHE